MRGRRALFCAALAAAIVLPTSPAVAEVAIPRLTLREKVGQLVMFSLQSTHLTTQEAEMIRRHHLGGVILFGTNYTDRQQLTALNARIQKVVKRGSGGNIGALISVDQEGGVVKRFKDMPPWRSAPELGRTGDPTAARNEGRATGAALRNAGVNVDLAPVADLDIGPNHVMRSRAFGSKPRRVAKMATAFALGLQDKRVAAVVKHFPGLGGADINSDAGRAYVRRSRYQLRQIDAVPFERAIGAGTKMIMMSHAIYPKDGGPRPASLNRFITTTRLRKHLGFTGVSITDAVDAMKWWYGGDIGKTCRGSIRAGADIALLANNVQAAAECAIEIRRGVNSGAISRDRIDQAVQRILTLKRWLRVYTPR